VLGRANRLLARFADVLALGFAKTRFAERYHVETVITGNPVRDRAQAVADVPYPALGETDAIQVLVFGGSQGARAFADLVPPAIAQLSEATRQRLRLVQQCRLEDLDRVTEAYRLAKVNVELATFFDDLPERMSKSHLVISRSGASTVAELGVLGRPAILIPLPGSIDADQRENARFVDNAGGGWIAEQATLSPLSLGTRLNELFDNPDVLVKAAAQAKTLGQRDAVGKLADLAEKLA
jgi:UDP-N-acetylglucosamine--N-acetylmuramyl-(pentapeptide) pyrophosphoryl-undecaprenol N-acetylglucosamine transferase